MPTIEIEDGVLKVDGYDGVRTRPALMTTISTSIALLALMAGLFKSETILIIAGCLGSLIGLYSALWGSSTTIQIHKDGEWESIGKHTSKKAEEIKAQLIEKL